MSKICFAILVHNNKKSLKDMIDNIRRFCPRSSIVLYNGGDDPKLCRGLGVPVCPASKKLVYPTSISTYMLEVMDWLVDTNYKFDYLINLDSDCLFARKGFESFVKKEMKKCDYMGVRVRTPTDDWLPYRNFKKEWAIWKPVFKKKDNLLCCFNVGQIYRRRLVVKIVRISKSLRVKDKLLRTKSNGIVEILYVSLARKLGARIKRYPSSVDGSIRYRPHFTAGEVKRTLRQKPRHSLFHPIYRDIGNDARVAIRNRAIRQGK
jgi:hypothetical protein